MASYIQKPSPSDGILSEETLLREGNDLMNICRHIYSHTPQTLEYVLQQEESRKGYESKLQRILNILRIYLELLLEFVELSPVVTSAFPRHRSVCVPELSVPALAYKIWNRVKILTTDNISKELNCISDECERGIASVETQTQILSLTTCECCHLSQSVVKELVARVEFFCTTHDIKESSVLYTKEQLRTKIYDVTNWEAMTQWCKALSTDIEQLTEISDKLLTNWKKERAKERKRYEQLEKKMKAITDRQESRKAEESGELLNTNKQLIVQLEQKTEEIKELKKILEDYNKEKEKNKELLSGFERRNSREMEELTNKLKDYELSSKSIQEECNNLKTNSQKDKERIKELEEKIKENICEINNITANYEKEILKYGKRVKELEGECNKRKATLNEQSKTIEMKNKQIDMLKENELEMQKKLENDEIMIAFLSHLKEDYKNLEFELDNRKREEIILQEKINQLERQRYIPGE